MEKDPKTSTKVYYYLDDNTPYLSVIPVPESGITLGDFKKAFVKKGYKYFCKQLDKTIGCEVKVEIHDDTTKLEKSANGLIELVLLSVASSHTSGTLPRVNARRINEQKLAVNNDNDLKKRRSLHDLESYSKVNGCEDVNRPLNFKSTENSITASSLSTVVSKRAGEILVEQYTSNSDDPYGLDENPKLPVLPESFKPSSSTVRNQIQARIHRQRRPRKQKYRKAYIPSTISSITESSMTSLSIPRIDVVTLPMKAGTFLGISVLSHDGGIFVSDVIKGGAVYSDGRIGVGDQIVQVNRNSFENLNDLQAVRLLRQAAVSRRPVTLYVAKRSRNDDRRSDVLSGLASETMPIDVSLWVESTKQNTMKKPFAIDGHSTVELDEKTDTDLEGAYLERRTGCVPVCGPATNAAKIRIQSEVPSKNLTAEDVARRRENEENEQLFEALNITMDPMVILKHMARVDSGLQIKNRKWLKIPVPMSFIGRDLIDWLVIHVRGLSDRKSARLYASKLLSDGLIRHVVNKLTFTEKCYYVFDESILSARNTTQSDTSAGKTEATTEVTYVGSPAVQQIPRVGLRNHNLEVNKLADIDEVWSACIPDRPLIPKRKDCESPLTNDYASVIGPDLPMSATVNPSTEAVAMRHGYRSVRSSEDHHIILQDDILVSQPPNTPNSMAFDRLNMLSGASETEFEILEEERKRFENVM